MKKLAVLVIALMLIPAMSFALEEQTSVSVQELIITTYSHDYNVTGGISASKDEDTGTVTYSATVTIRDMSAKANVKAWSDPLPTDVTTMSLTDVADGASTWKSAGTTDLKAAILSMIQNTMRVVSVIQTANKLARFTFGGVSLYDSDTGTEVASPGVPTAITWP